MAGVLYRKEREVLEFLAQFQRQYGYSPTLGEIAKATGHKSNATIHALIASLVEKGYVQKVEGNARVLKILDQKLASTLTGTQPAIELPLMGFISEGKPLEPYSDPNATFQVSGNLMTGQKTAYVLQVKGESFLKEGIMDGDHLVVEKTKDPQEGEIVVAIINENRATIRKYSKDGERIVLKPVFSLEEPLSPSTVTIQGRVTTIIRKFI